jgi:Zn-dependent metalloprotease
MQRFIRWAAVLFTAGIITHPFSFSPLRAETSQAATGAGNFQLQAEPVIWSEPQTSTSSVTLTSKADAYIDSGLPTTNFGLSTALHVGQLTTSRFSRALIRFDFSPIPPNAIIQSAILQMYNSGGSTMPASLTVGIYRLDGNWSEIGVRWSIQPARAAIGKSTPIGLTNGYYSWEITDLVQDWVDGARPNFGLALLSEPETIVGYRTFSSRENPALAPQLLVSYSGEFATTDPQVAGLRRLQANSSEPVRFRFARGIPAYLHANLPAGGPSGNLLAQARAFLNAYKDLYRINDPVSQFRLVRRRLDGAASHLFFQQLHQGVPVFGAELGVHLKNGSFTSSSGNYLADLDLSILPKISSVQAESAAIAHRQTMTSSAAPVAIGQTSLMIFDRNLFSNNLPDPRLVWRVNLSRAGNWTYLVDARTGSVIDWITLDRTAMDLEIFDARNDYSWCCWCILDDPSELWFTEEGEEPDVVTDSDGRNANELIRDLYRYYRETFDRRSFDNDEEQIEIYVNVDHVAQYGRPNSFWYGGACEVIEFSDNWVTRDIMGHEFTHGVTESEYFSEDQFHRDRPGALNESLADTIGTFFEWDSDLFPNWTIGEDLVNGPNRNMEDPTTETDDCDGVTYRHPDHNDFYLDNYPCDDGGVHINAGIPNKAAWLISTTGEHTHHGISVTGLGVEIAEQIFYRTITNYLVANAEFFSLRDGMIESAEELFGRVSSQVCSVRNGYAAVGIGYSDTDCDGLDDHADEDNDDDGVDDPDDNCLRVPNPNQENIDGDLAGDACDSDRDGDLFHDNIDNCPAIANPGQLDTDHDGVGEACDDDEPPIHIADEIFNAHPNDTVWDNCRFQYNPFQEDNDGDQTGDVCDSDDDNDLIYDSGTSHYCACGETQFCNDNAPLVYNNDQSDQDCDGVGDVVDNCPDDANPYVGEDYPPVQPDMNEDGEGDACDDDIDGDHWDNVVDNCDYEINYDQADLDRNGIGFKCDPDEAFLLSQGAHLLFIELPPDGPLTLPIFPCLDDGCPDTYSVFPDGQRVALYLNMPLPFSLRVLNEAGSLIRRDHRQTLGKALSFEVHPSYQFDLEAMALLESASDSLLVNTEDALEYAQRPLYFLEIWPTAETIPGQVYPLQFSLAIVPPGSWMYFPVIRR